MADPVIPPTTPPAAPTPGAPETPGAPTTPPATTKPGLLQRAAEQIKKGLQGAAEGYTAGFSDASGVYGAQQATFILKGTADIGGDLTKVRPSDRIQPIPKKGLAGIEDIKASFTTIKTPLGPEVDRVLTQSRKEIMDVVERSHTVLKTRILSLQDSVKVLDKNVKVVDIRTRSFQEESEKTLAGLKKQLGKLEAQQQPDQKFQKIGIPEKKADATISGGGFGLLEGLAGLGLTAATISTLVGLVSAGLTGGIVASLIALLKLGKSRTDKPKGYDPKDYYLGPPPDTPQGKRMQEDLASWPDLAAIMQGLPPRERYSAEKTEWWRSWGRAGSMAIPGIATGRALGAAGSWFLGGTPAGAAERPPIGTPGQFQRGGGGGYGGMGPGWSTPPQLYGGWGQPQAGTGRGTGGRWIGAPGAAAYGISPRGGGAMSGGSADVTGMIGQPSARAPVTGELGRYLHQYGGGAPAAGGYAPGLESVREQILRRPPSTMFGPGASGIPERPGVFGYIGQDPGLIMGRGEGAAGGWGGFFGGGAGAFGGVPGGGVPRARGAGGGIGGPTYAPTAATPPPPAPKTAIQQQIERKFIDTGEITVSEAKTLFGTKPDGTINAPPGLNLPPPQPGAPAGPAMAKVREAVRGAQPRRREEWETTPSTPEMQAREQRREIPRRREEWQAGAVTPEMKARVGGQGPQISVPSFRQTPSTPEMQARVGGQGPTVSAPAWQQTPSTPEMQARVGGQGPTVSAPAWQPTIPDTGVTARVQPYPVATAGRPPEVPRALPAGTGTIMRKAPPGALGPEMVTGGRTPEERAALLGVPSPTAIRRTAGAYPGAPGALGGIEPGAAILAGETGKRRPGEGVQVAMERAAKDLGVDPRIVWGKASVESSYQAGASAGISSATGLGQILKGTWKEIAAYPEAAKYGITGALDERLDPYKSAVGSMLYSKHNIEKLKGQGLITDDMLKKNPGLYYIPHNLGPDGASRFLRGLKDNPNASVSDYLSATEIRNNPSIYTRGGRTLTVQEALGNIESGAFGEGVRLRQKLAEEGTLPTPAGGVTATAAADAAASAGAAGATPPPVQAVAPGEVRVSELQGQVAGVRRGALKGSLKEQLEYSAAQAGVYVDVTSGGQRMEGAPGSTGSHRHDEGGAADVNLYVMENGKKRTLDPRKEEDQPLIAKFTQEFARVNPEAGVGASYMSDPTKIHYGGANAPGGKPVAYEGAQWFRDAHATGIAMGQAERAKGEDALASWKTSQETEVAAAPVDLRTGAEPRKTEFPEVTKTDITTAAPAVTPTTPEPSAGEYLKQKQASTEQATAGTTQGERTAGLPQYTMTGGEVEQLKAAQAVQATKVGAAQRAAGAYPGAQPKAVVTPAKPIADIPSAATTKKLAEGPVTIAAQPKKQVDLTPKTDDTKSKDSAVRLPKEGEKKESPVKKKEEGGRQQAAAKPKSSAVTPKQNQKAPSQDMPSVPGDRGTESGGGGGSPERCHFCDP